MQFIFNKKNNFINLKSYILLIINGIKRLIYFYYLLQRLNLNNKIRNNDKRLTILSRCACLGKSCMDELNIKRNFNLQKGRIDMYVYRYKITSPKWLYPIMRNFDILNFCNEINFKNMYQKKYKFIIMDSFSELVDSKYTLSDNSVFFGVKRDINHEKLRKNNGIYHKQLKLNELMKLYNLGFDNLNKKFDCNIYFILYPQKFEVNEYYIKRGEKIKEILKELSLKLSYLKIIEIEDKKVFKSNEDDFPYHFDSKTIRKFSKKIFDTLSETDKDFINSFS